MVKSLSSWVKFYCPVRGIYFPRNTAERRSTKDWMPSFMSSLLKTRSLIFWDVIDRSLFTGLDVFQRGFLRSSMPIRTFLAIRAAISIARAICWPGATTS